MGNFNIFYAIANSSIINQLVFLALALLSAGLWTIVFQKISNFLKYIKLLDQLENIIRMQDIASLKSYSLTKNNAYAEMVSYVIANYKTISKNELQEVALLFLSKKNYKLGLHVPYLGIIANASPFIGLFGTVVGVVNTFQQMAVSNSVALSAVAPGIAEALYATAFGLFVAVPSAIAFNMFNVKLEDMSQKENLLIGQVVFMLKNGYFQE